MPNAEDRIKKVIAATLNVAPEKVVPQARLNKDLMADSLDMVEVIIELENEFNISVPDERIGTFETVQDLIDYTQLLLAAELVLTGKA